MEINVRRSLLSVILCLSLIAPALVFQGPSASAAKKRAVKCDKVTRPVNDQDPEGDGGPPAGGPTMKFRFCTGKVTSKDGTTKLDTSVTMPAKGDGPFPLIVMLHGLTGSRKSNESDFVVGKGARHHYNNLWFASKGYMVLSFTARGWRIFNTSNTSETISHSHCIDKTKQSIDGNPASMYPGPDPACYIQISHLKYDVVDTQYLVGKLVDGTLTNARGVKAKRKVGVTGVSLGGGQTWLLTRKNQWKSPKGVRIKVGAAAPIIGWTDLVDALAPNGRRRDTDTAKSLAARKAEPAGVKNDYVDVFYEGVRTFATDFIQTTDYLREWKEEFTAGEPYEEDPVIADAIHKLLTRRSAWYVKKTTSFDTPIFAVQGMTDGIFWGHQSLTMYNRLQKEREDANRLMYPMRLYLGDWGHSPSQNKQAEFDYFVSILNKWFDHYIKGKRSKPANTIEARLTICNGSDGILGPVYRGADWAEVTGGTPWVMSDPGPFTLTTPSGDPHNQTLVPADGGRPNPEPGGEEGINGVKDASCRTTDTAIDDDNHALPTEQWPLILGSFRLLGMPEITLDATSSGDEMYIAARLWDVFEGELPGPQDDTQTLITRGVVRLGAAGEHNDVTFEMFGNGYEIPPDHSIRVELTADDSPSWQKWKGGAPGSIEIDDFQITIPAARCENLVQSPAPECDA